MKSKRYVFRRGHQHKRGQQLSIYRAGGYYILPDDVAAAVYDPEDPDPIAVPEDKVEPDESAAPSEPIPGALVDAEFADDLEDSF